MLTFIRENQLLYQLHAQLDDTDDPPVYLTEGLNLPTDPEVPLERIDGRMSDILAKFALRETITCGPTRTWVRHRDFDAVDYSIKLDRLLASGSGYVDGPNWEMDFYIDETQKILIMAERIPDTITQWNPTWIAGKGVQPKDFSRTFDDIEETGV